MHRDPRYLQFQNICTTQSATIQSALRQSWAGIDFSQTEPDIVRQYLSEPNLGVDFLNRHVATPLSIGGYDVKFGSVFIHQKPLIERSSPCPPGEKRCELGDLLVVFTFLDSTKRPLLNRAFIAQAKKHAALDSICQRALYEEEQSFSFPQSLVAQSWSCRSTPERFLPASAQSRWHGLKYLILDASASAATCVYVPWDHGLQSDWSIPLLGILSGFDGLGFSRSPYRGQGWSAIIWDLLGVTAKAVTKGQTRGNAIEMLADEYNAFSSYQEFYRVVKEGPGLPTLLIFVRDRESKGKHWQGLK